MFSHDMGYYQHVNVFLLSRYVWEHLEVGYVQGMCDLLAPLLVIFDDGKSLKSVICA